MNTHIGHGIQPLSGGQIKATEIVNLQTVEKVLFDIADAVLYPPFLITFADATGLDGEACLYGNIA
jgi:hypothetical protein